MSESENAGYERKDLHSHAVLWTAVALIVTLIATFVAMRIFESVLGGSRYHDAARQALAPTANVPLPRLQTNSAADLAALRAAEEARLHSYGWVDREDGVIHIPIERAMDLTLQRGLPAREAKKGSAP